MDTATFQPIPITLSALFAKLAKQYAADNCRIEPGTEADITAALGTDHWELYGLASARFVTFEVSDGRIYQVPLPLTKAQAVALSHGATLYHRTMRNSDGTALRARPNGRCQTWVTRPEEFRLPAKHGLRDTFYITHTNCGEWSLVEPKYDGKK